MDLTKITTGGAALHHLARGDINKDEFDDVIDVLYRTGEIDWWWFNELHEEAIQIEQDCSQFGVGA